MTNERQAEYRRRYNASEKGRDSRRRYAATPAGKAAQRKAKLKWQAKNPGYHTRAAAERFGRLAERVNAIKLASGCVDCGYNAHPAALDFDHVGPAEKIDNVSRLIRLRSWEVIEAEIAKCEVVCANCHRIRTVGRLGAAS
jgi:hypothetical protein